MTTLVTLHQRHDRNGWQPVKTADANDPTWDQFDQSFIDEGLRQGSGSIRVGDCIYEFKQEKP